MVCARLHHAALVMTCTRRPSIGGHENWPTVPMGGNRGRSELKHLKTAVPKYCWVHLRPLKVSLRGAFRCSSGAVKGELGVYALGALGSRARQLPGGPIVWHCRARGTSRGCAASRSEGITRRVLWGSSHFALAFSRTLREARTPVAASLSALNGPPQSTSGSRRVHVRCSSRASRVVTFPVSFSQTDLRSPSTF